MADTRTLSIRARSSLLGSLVACALVSALLAGCGGAEEPRVEPQVAPPALSQAGQLRAGVDFSTPPFAGKDGTRQAGIDIDVASALADQLGLEVKFLDVTPSQAASALADAKVDVVLSASVDQVDLSAVTLAGSYVDDAPAFFVAREGGSLPETLTLETLPSSRVAVQSSSLSHWLLKSEYGAGAVTAYPTLREALESVERGQREVAMGDAVVGAYMLRDMPKLRFAGQAAPAQPISVAVAAQNAALEEAVREALDELAAGGILDSIRGKWVGDLPALSVER